MERLPDRREIRDQNLFANINNTDSPKILDRRDPGASGL